jgi:hypothetical protein
MSAILNALKKLEDEKSSIDDSISFNELKIHSEPGESSNPLRDKLLQWRGKILLVLAGILFGGLIGKLY